MHPFGNNLPACSDILSNHQSGDHPLLMPFNVCTGNPLSLNPNQSPDCLDPIYNRPSSEQSVLGVY